ncbi:MAG: hypothetical protein ACFFC7_01535 [Candidatus Hermodarchaeota archaeon]
MTIVMEVNWFNFLASKRLPVGGQFIETTIYEMYNILTYALILITLILWIYSLLRTFKFSPEKSNAEKLEILFFPILFTLGTGEGILSFIISGSLDMIHWNLDYVSWALMVVGWFYLIIILEAFREVFQKMKISSFSPNQLYLGLGVFLSTFWVVSRLIFGVNLGITILSLFYGLGFVLLILITLREDFSSIMFFRLFFILVMFFSALIVYPGFVIDPPLMSTQVYINLRNQIIILGLEAISLFFLMNYKNLGVKAPFFKGEMQR